MMINAMRALGRRTCRALGALPPPLAGEGWGGGDTHERVLLLPPSLSLPQHQRVYARLRRAMRGGVTPGTDLGNDAMPERRGDRRGRAPRSRRRAALRCQMAADRRARGAGRLARARAARLPALAERAHPADRGRAGRIHAGEFPHRLSQRRQRAPVRQFGAVRGRRRRARAGRRHRSRLDERAHQHAVQDAVLRARDHPAGDPRHPVHGGVDHAGEPEDRPDQSRAAEAHRHRCRVRRHLHHGGHDLGRRAALLADGLPADDGGVPLHGPRARGAGGDERRLGGADRAPHHAEARLAGGAGIAADPVRARDRVVRGAGAARAAGRHPRLHLVDLPGDPPVSEPGRARRRLCGDLAAAHLARHLCAVAALRARARASRP